MDNKEVYELVKDTTKQITDQVRGTKQPLKDSAYLILGKHEEQMIALATGGNPMEISKMLASVAHENPHMKKAILIAALAIMHGSHGFEGVSSNTVALEFTKSSYANET